MAEPARLRGYYALMRGLFATGYGVLGLRREVTRQNLQRSFPGLGADRLREIEREHRRRMSELAAEVLYATRIEPDELRERVILVNPEVLTGAEPRRPTVFAAAHHCNFEWMLLRASQELGEGLLALYKPMKSERADRVFQRMRTRFGARLVPAKSVLQELARFREARAVCLIADQVPRTSPEKHWLRFLGQDTAFFMGPELLARALRSQLAYTRMSRLERGRYQVEFVLLNSPGEKLPTGELTARYAAALEQDILRDPAGWWWGHRRWKLKREERDQGTGTSN
jgi:KDO2-lipid IV(A) lauroyltransferase